MGFHAQVGFWVDMAGPHDTLFDFRRWGWVGSWSGPNGRLEGWIARTYTSAYEMNKLAAGRKTHLIVDTCDFT